LCPECGTPLVKAEDEAKWFCPNTSACPPQIKGRIEHFISRKAMNILAGEATIAQFYDAALVQSPSDLYSLSLYDLTALDGWQDKSARRFLDSLKESLSVPFERVLFALGIRYVGETTAKSLARHFGNIDRLIGTDMDDLLAVGDVGDVIARSVYDFMHDAGNLEEIERLRKAGLRFTIDEGRQVKSDVLSGKTIVISGNFSVSRDEMKGIIEANGGKCSSSVSRKTAFLLAGTKPGPEKIAKCTDLGVTVITEDEFRAMLPESGREEGTANQLSLF